MPVPRHGRCAGASAARPSPGRSCFFQEAQAYADDNSLLFMETSAKTAMNVNDLFLAIGEAPGAAGGARLGSKGVCLGRSSPRPPQAFWEAEQSWCLSCPLVSAAPHGPAVAAPWAAVLLPGLSTKADAQCESGLRGNCSFPWGSAWALSMQLGWLQSLCCAQGRVLPGPSGYSSSGAVLQSEPPSRSRHHLACLPPPAKKLPKSEPQSTSGAAGRSRGVDLHEQSQQNKSQCCSN